MKKILFIFSLLFLIGGCTSSDDAAEQIEVFEINDRAFEDILEDIDLQSFMDRDSYFSSVEIASVREDFERVNGKIIEAQNYSKSQRELINSLLLAHPSPETEEYFLNYLSSLDYYDQALQNYSLGLSQFKVFVDYSELEVEYDELDEEYWASVDDFYRYMDLDDYDNASRETQEIINALNRQIEIYDEQEASIHFSFNEDFKELDMLYLKYFNTAAEQLQEDWPTEAKVYDAIDDIGDEIGLFNTPTSYDVDEEFDQWYYDHVEVYLSDADESFQDGASEYYDAEDYLDRYLDNELVFRTFTFRAPEKE